MKCFFHHDRDAVGGCKSCGRGLCPECAADLGKGLACKGRCEEDVRGIIRLVESNVRANPQMLSIVRKGRTTGILLAVFFIALGLVFLAWGLLSEQGEFTAILGALFAIFGVIFLIRTLTAPKVDEDQNTA